MQHQSGCRMKYAQLLNDGFLEDQSGENACGSKIEFLARHVFDFTTYDSDMDQLLGQKAVEVCRALSSRATHGYIKVPENYRWYIVMCNMPFFTPRLDWGTSIRGAWWAHDQPPLTSCGLYEGERQVIRLDFADGEWEDFIAAVLEFSDDE